MGKMAPLIGKEATEKYFLDVFVHLCSNEGYKIRIKCVKSLGEMSVVLGTETTEKYLVSKKTRWSGNEVRLHGGMSEIQISGFSVCFSS